MGCLSSLYRHVVDAVLSATQFVNDVVRNVVSYHRSRDSDLEYDTPVHLLSLRTLESTHNVRAIELREASQSLRTNVPLPSHRFGVARGGGHGFRRPTLLAVSRALEGALSEQREKAKCGAEPKLQQAKGAQNIDAAVKSENKMKIRNAAGECYIANATGEAIDDYHRTNTQREMVKCNVMDVEETPENENCTDTWKEAKECSAINNQEAKVECNIIHTTDTVETLNRTADVATGECNGSIMDEYNKTVIKEAVDGCTSTNINEAVDKHNETNIEEAMNDCKRPSMDGMVDKCDRT